MAKESSKWDCFAAGLTCFEQLASGLTAAALRVAAVASISGDVVELDFVAAQLVYCVVVVVASKLTVFAVVIVQLFGN